MNLSKFIQEELLCRIDIRLGTILEDSDSATDFESEVSLDALGHKIKHTDAEFSADELQWIKEELENELEILSSTLEDPELKGQAEKEIKKIKSFIRTL